MTARDILMSAGGASQEKLYVDDVFSTYLYAGNGASQTINNGIDLAGKGGMVWARARNAGDNNSIYDTKRGGTKRLVTNSQNAEDTLAGNSFVSFNSNGFSLLASTSNSSGYSCASWAFRCAPKFFDVVTYASNGSVKTVPHSLGIKPGLIFVKKTNGAASWIVYSASLGATKALILDSTSAALDFGAAWNSTEPTSENFTIGAAGDVNASGGTYVAYLFAHDTSPDGLIQCGNFTTDGSGNATISLGWEPQFVLLKASSASNGWVMMDSMRGMPAGGADAQLYPHVSNGEAFINTLDPTATGFNATGLSASTTYIYMAIRRPNKPPTSGISVLYKTIGSGMIVGTNTGKTLDDFSISDFYIARPQRTNAATPAWLFADSLRGMGKSGTDEYGTGAGFASILDSSAASAESIRTSTPSIFRTNHSNYERVTFGGMSFPGIAYALRRAYGFMEIVCYTGTGIARAVAHGLGATPELMIIKSRSSATDWQVYFGAGDRYLVLNTAAAQVTGNSDRWNGFSPYATAFSLGNSSTVNASGATYVAYLFATLPGISKCGSFMGNGTSQTINCGFSAGARFVLIKRIDAAGDWYVWDTDRGISASNDPHLSLNSTAAEVTTDDSIDPDASGFIVNQVAATNINFSGGQYIFLAIA